MQSGRDEGARLADVNNRWVEAPRGCLVTAAPPSPSSSAGARAGTVHPRVLAHSRGRQQHTGARERLPCCTRQSTAAAQHGSRLRTTERRRERRERGERKRRERHPRSKRASRAAHKQPSGKRMHLLGVWLNDLYGARRGAAAGGTAGWKWNASLPAATSQCDGATSLWRITSGRFSHI